MKAVLDTNVIASALLTKTSPPAVILDHLKQAAPFELLLSEPILVEYRRVITYPRVQARHHLTLDKIEQFIATLRELATLVEPAEEVTVVERDPDGNKFIACALAGGAEYVVSGDADLLDISTYRGVRILRPTIFLALLDQEQEQAA